MKRSIFMAAFMAAFLSFITIDHAGLLYAQSQNKPTKDKTAGTSAASSDSGDQDDESGSGSFTVDNFFISLSNNTLSVEDSSKQIVFKQSFSHPAGYLADLDGDGTEEFLLNDYTESQGLDHYTLYVFNTVDTFYLADSIYSGLKEPYYTQSPEIKGVLLVTGSPDIDSLYTPQLDNSFSPLVCWAVVEGELTIVNERLYDIFIEENEKLIGFIDTYIKANGRDCGVARVLKNAIGTLYINYIYAGEKSSAESALRQYYKCDDIESFRQELQKIL